LNWIRLNDRPAGRTAPFACIADASIQLTRPHFPPATPFTDLNSRLLRAESASGRTSMVASEASIRRPHSVSRDRTPGHVHYSTLPLQHLPLSPEACGT
jgi:hypothetical protein